MYIGDMDKIRNPEEIGVFQTVNDAKRVAGGGVTLRLSEKFCFMLMTISYLWKTCSLPGRNFQGVKRTR